MKYLIAYVFRNDAAEKIDALRKSLSQTFDVHEALRMPPHITLFYPFDTTPEDAPRLQSALDELVKTTKSFTLPVTGFKSFEGGVWFLDVEQKAELHSLKNSVVHSVERSLGILDQSSFPEVHFHCTLAFRDVTPETLIAIGEYLKDAPLPVTGVNVDAVSVLEQQQDRIWKILSTHSFSS